MTSDPGGPGTDEKLRDVLGALAAGVPISADAYQEVRAEWTRRQRRRRRLAVIIAVVIVLVADVVGLWALNRSENGGQLIFDDRPPATQPGQPPVQPAGQP